MSLGGLARRREFFWLSPLSGRLCIRIMFGKLPVVSDRTCDQGGTRERLVAGGAGGVILPDNQEVGRRCSAIYVLIYIKLRFWRVFSRSGGRGHVTIDIGSFMWIKWSSRGF